MRPCGGDAYEPGWAVGAECLGCRRAAIEGCDAVHPPGLVAVRAPDTGKCLGLRGPAWLVALKAGKLEAVDE